MTDMAGVQIVIASVDVDLCEDRRTVIAWGYGADDAVYVQSVTCPFNIDPDAFLGDDWLQAFSRDSWRRVA